MVLCRVWSWKVLFVILEESRNVDLCCPIRWSLCWRTAADPILHAWNENTVNSGKNICIYQSFRDIQAWRGISILLPTQKSFDMIFSSTWWCSFRWNIWQTIASLQQTILPVFHMGRMLSRSKVAKIPTSKYQICLIKQPNKKCGKICDIMGSGYTVKICVFCALLWGRVIRDVGLYASTYGIL